ncbi:MAG: ATP-binding domain-containing protein [Solibacillus sp.]
MIDQNEITYLQQTLQSLRSALTYVEADITTKDVHYKDLQKYVMDYKAELDKFEVYDYQHSLHMIDKHGLAKVLEREKISKLIHSPYFGRFQFVYDGDKTAESFYIGRFGHRDQDGETLIYDWRAPVCNMYYEFELGAAFYEVTSGRFDGELTAKRQIKIEDSAIQYVLDSSLTIQDEVLQQTLNAHASDKMKTIITSIQREQNQIVRNESTYNVVIQGVAGSGKTAVALHRLAYYLYKFRDTLRAERIFILSPNKVFGDYISSVLPELGEQPIRSFTLDELTANLLPTAVTFTPFEQETKVILQNPTSNLTKRTALKANFNFVEKLQQFLAELDTTLFKREAISIADVMFSADYLQGRFQAYKREPVTTRLTLMTEDIVHVLKSKYDGAGKLPSKNDIVKRLKKRLLYGTPLEIYRAFMDTLGEKLFQFKQKKFEFNDVYPYLYVQLYFKGIKSYELVQHFVLDEMQDYTPIQYAVLAKVFACKRTIIGDFSQALLPYDTISKEAFQAILPNLEYVELTTTYRSSYEIAMYAKKFMRTGDIQPIARHGKAPVELQYDTLEAMMAHIVSEVQNDYKTTAIICKNDADLACVTAKLKNTPHRVINGETTTFEAGVIVTTIQYAKGLEFDKVIIPFVHADNYQTAFDRGLLYIATTRAMHELVMLVDAQNPSPLV